MNECLLVLVVSHGALGNIVGLLHGHVHATILHAHHLQLLLLGRHVWANIAQHVCLILAKTRLVLQVCVNNYFQLDPSE